jgi:hypothetical protein
MIQHKTIKSSTIFATIIWVLSCQQKWMHNTANMSLWAEVLILGIDSSSGRDSSMLRSIRIKIFKLALN